LLRNWSHGFYFYEYQIEKNWMYFKDSFLL
jgi:hypothetical protein